MNRFGLSNQMTKKLGIYVLCMFYKEFKKRIWKLRSSQIQDLEKCAGITLRMKFNKNRTSTSSHNNLEKGQVEDHKRMAYQMCEDFLIKSVRVG
jgi:hypothetical protein